MILEVDDAGDGDGGSGDGEVPVKSKAAVDHLADLIVQRLKDEHHAMWIDPETHAAQHEFVMLLMEERNERLRRRKNLEDKIAGSLILSLIMALVALLGSGTMDWVRGHLR